MVQKTEGRASAVTKPIQHNHVTTVCTRDFRVTVAPADGVCPVTFANRSKNGTCTATRLSPMLRHKPPHHYRKNQQHKEPRICKSNHFILYTNQLRTTLLQSAHISSPPIRQLQQISPRSFREIIPPRRAIQKFQPRFTIQTRHLIPLKLHHTNPFQQR